MVERIPSMWEFCRIGKLGYPFPSSMPPPINHIFNCTKQMLNVNLIFMIIGIYVKYRM